MTNFTPVNSSENPESPLLHCSYEYYVCLVENDILGSHLLVNIASSDETTYIKMLVWDQLCQNSVDVNSLLLSWMSKKC